MEFAAAADDVAAGDPVGATAELGTAVVVCAGGDEVDVQATSRAAAPIPAVSLIGPGQSSRSRTATVSSRPGPTPTAEIGALIIFSSVWT